MKNIFTTMMLLLAIAAGTSLVSCKKNVEKKYSAKEQANKLDATGEAFIQEIDLENWQATADLVIPGIIFLNEADMSAAEEPEIEEEENTVDVPNLIWTRTYTIDMSNAKGHYIIDEEGKGAKLEGDFNDFQIAFTTEDHEYVVNIAFTNSDKTIRLIYDEYEADYYYDENDQYVNCPGMVRKSSTYLVVPAKMTADFTVDGSKHFTAVGNLTFNGYEDFHEAPDLKAITVDANLMVKAGNYTLNLSRLSLKKGIFDETFTFSHNKKQLLALTAKATGLDYIEKVGVKSGEEEEEDDDFPFACDNAQVALDVLGQVQVKGALKFNNLYNTCLGLNWDVETVEDVNAELKKLEPYYNLSVYYDKGSIVQAYVKVKAYEEEREDGANPYIIIAPVIFFQDGTSQGVTEFFNDKNFPKTLAALERFVTRIQTYFESFEPESDSEPLH